MTYADFVAEVVALDPDIHPEYEADFLQQAYEDGETPNSTVISLQYRNACRKADRQC